MAFEMLVFVVLADKPLFDGLIYYHNVDSKLELQKYNKTLSYFIGFYRLKINCYSNFKISAKVFVFQYFECLISNPGSSTFI